MDEELERYVREVARRVKLHAAVLFGSRARGDHGPWSGYDLLLIGEFREPYLEEAESPDGDGGLHPGRAPPIHARGGLGDA